MTSDEHKVGLIPATLMVAGNIMGAGVFLLPANLAATGGIAIYGWIVATIGAVCLSLVYAKVAAANASTGGSYGYARSRFGNLAGYQVNLFYWVSNWIGNVGIAVVGVSYLKLFFPVLKSPWMAGAAALGAIWLLTYVNILGPKVVARVQSVTTILALFVIVGVGLMSWFRFSSETYMASWDVKSLGDIPAIQSVMSITLWAFVGVETAAVAAGVVENPQKNVPIATVGGVLIAAFCYIMSCVGIMGVIPGPELAASNAPFADAARDILGSAADWVISFCAAAACLGALGGWIMATALSAKAAADDGLFPAIFKHSNAKGAPVQGLLIVGSLMSLVLLGTVSPAATTEFASIASIAVLLVLVAYLYVIAACLSYRKGYVISVVAMLFCGWAIWSTKHQESTWLAILLLVSVSLYALSRKNEPRT